jgi:hypothetical protein
MHAPHTNKYKYISMKLYRKKIESRINPSILLKYFCNIFKIITQFTLTNIKDVLIFVQLAFNLNNIVTDTLESNTILIYSREHISLYTQSLARTL